MKHYEAEMLGHKSHGLCDHPSNPFLFRGFFQQSLFSFSNFQIFYYTSVRGSCRGEFGEVGYTLRVNDQKESK